MTDTPSTTPAKDDYLEMNENAAGILSPEDKLEAYKMELAERTVTAFEKFVRAFASKSFH